MAVTDDHLQGGLSVDAHQPTPKIMTIPPTPTSRFRREDRDTGFPEPFGENYNTTLPHPDADLSPNATISQDDLSVEQALKRRRLSMLNKHRRTASQTSSIGGASIPGVLSIISAYIPAGSVDPSSGAAAGGPASYSSGASNSYARGGDDDETPPLSPSSQQGGTSVDGDQGRRDSGGRLRRWISSRR